jgi:HEAT repeat protein
MASNSDLEDLVNFLKSPSPQLRKAAVDIVQGLTGSQDGIHNLSPRAHDFFPPLLHLLGDKQAIVSFSPSELPGL